MQGRRVVRTQPGGRRDDVYEHRAIQSKGQALASFAADKSVLESIALLEPTVRVDGNTAIITGINRTRGRDAQGKPFDRRALFTGTWVKRDGRWMVQAFQGTVIP